MLLLYKSYNKVKKYKNAKYYKMIDKKNAKF